jgi:fido (protein-threonine AMPylation protein)
MPFGPERLYNKLHRLVEERRELLQRLGGISLDLVQVANEEWLYMLGEDTRHSLAIEGFFVTEKELKDVLQGRRGSLEVLNYFRTAQFVYEQALQDAQGGPLRLDKAWINNIHGQLFRETALDRQRGKPADGIPRVIQGAKVKPPLEASEYLGAFVDVVRYIWERELLEVLAKAHVLFEAIHPYLDGNGRVGRLLLNYLAIYRGLPPLVVKGLGEADRQRYYQALEAADRGFHGGFPPPDPKALIQALDAGEWRPLALLLGESLLPRLDRVLGLALMRFVDLMPMEEVARAMGVEREQVYVWADRHRLAVYRSGGKGRLYSHPWLFLGTRRRPSPLPEELPPERPGWQDRLREMQRLLFHPEAL